jgi:hypothetical protein
MAQVQIHFPNHSTNPVLVPTDVPSPPLRHKRRKKTSGCQPTFCFPPTNFCYAACFLPLVFRQLGETFYNLGETEKAIFHLTKALDTTVQSLPEQESVQFPLLEYLEQSNWNETSKSGLQNAGKSTRKLKKSQSSSNSEVVRIFLCFAQV